MRATGASNSPLRSATRVTEQAKTARRPAARRNSATELFMRGSNKSGASSPEGHGRGEEDRGSVSDSEVRKGDRERHKRRDGGGDEGNEQMIPPMTVFMPKTSAERISVLVRPRPMTHQERSAAADSQPVLRLDEQSHKVTLNPAVAATSRMGPAAGAWSFNFDHVLPATCEQARVFEAVGRQACLHFLDGYNVAIFAYGQTGAGKTYTLYGPAQAGRGGAESPSKAPTQLREAGEGRGDISEEAGMVPRCLFYIFSKIEELRARGAKLLMKVSFIEIYNESVIDLLSVHPRLLTVREDALHDRVFVEGANEANVNTLEEVAHLLSVGEQNRTTGATAMNAQSSRSHSVFTISLEAQEQQPDGRHLMRHSQFRLVDLAGSERQKYSKSEGRHLREASNINGSLTVLGKVIMALASGRKHIPYRDSKLTFLLKNSLGGNSKTILIANIALAARCQDESLSTLKFASFARKPLIHVSQNVINPDETVQDLQAQILRLKAQLLRDRTARNGISSPHAGPDGFGQDQDPHLPIVLTQSPDGGGGAGGEYARSLEVSLRQALEREQALREKLTRERHQFVGKLDEYDWLCKSLDQCLESSKRIIRFKDIKIRDLERGGGGGRDGTGAEGLSAAMLPASVATPAADPELVRARITIRALEEELALVRASEGPDSLAEREALEGEVTHLSEQVQILLARVYELEAAADQAGDVDHGQQLRQRDARVQELEERLQKLTTTLEDEKRAHISALELVQELREAEEEWAQTVQQSQEKMVQMQHQALPPFERNSCAGVAVQAVGDESKEPGEAAGQSCGAGGTEPKAKVEEPDEVQHLRELLKEKEATIHAQSEEIETLRAAEEEWVLAVRQAREGHVGSLGAGAQV